MSNPFEKRMKLEVRASLKHETMLRVAETLSVQSTCARRSVGCVLVDSLGKILATGYNGVPRGMNHCTDTPCEAASMASGKSLELCQAVHAEANALMQCSDVTSIYTAYCTTSPCAHCVKLLANTGCVNIIFREAYVHTASQQFWTESQGGRTWQNLVAPPNYL